MPSVHLEDGVRRFTNGTAVTLGAGDLVQLPDLSVGIVEGLAGVKVGATGNCKTNVTVICDKLTGTVIAAGDRIAFHPTTKLCIAQVGAAVGPAFIIGRAVEAAGAGVLTVKVELNFQGPTI